MRYRLVQKVRSDIADALNGGRVVDETLLVNYNGELKPINVRASRDSLSIYSRENERIGYNLVDNRLVDIQGYYTFIHELNTLVSEEWMLYILDNNADVLPTQITEFFSDDVDRGTHAMIVYRLNDEFHILTPDDDGAFVIPSQLFYTISLNSDYEDWSDILEEYKILFS